MSGTCPKCQAPWRVARQGSAMFICCSPGCGRRWLRMDGVAGREWAAVLAEKDAHTVVAVGREGPVWDAALRCRRAGQSLVVAALARAGDL